MREAVDAMATVVLAQYSTAPALMLCLSLILAVPVLVLAGGIVRPLSRVWGAGSAPARLAKACPSWPSEAWLEVDTAGSIPRVSIGNGLVRIGREQDNEVCLSDDSVHRYHAAIERDGDAAILLTDLSSRDGNGIRVNGRRVTAAHLADGDMIGLGKASLKFHSIPLAAAILPATAERHTR